MRFRKKRMIILCMMLALVFCTSAGVTAGAAKKNGLEKENGCYRYYQNGKLIKKSWKTINGRKYYFQKNGNAAVGSCKINKKYYIFNTKGQMYQPSKTKVVSVNGIKYRVNSKGRAVSGWDSKKKYYYQENGRMAAGIITIKSGYNCKFYCFNKNGKYNAAKTKKLQKAAQYEKNMKDVYALIGKPKKSYYDVGCYSPNGKDGVLTYDNFIVHTFRYNNGKEIFMAVE